MPGSEHVSPVSCAGNYPLSVAAAAASLPPTDASEETATDMPDEPVMSEPEMDNEKELAATDAKNGSDAAEEPVSNEEGKLLHRL